MGCGGADAEWRLYQMLRWKASRRPFVSKRDAAVRGVPYVACARRRLVAMSTVRKSPCVLDCVRR